MFSNVYVARKIHKLFAEFFSSNSTKLLILPLKNTALSYFAVKNLFYSKSQRACMQFKKFLITRNLILKRNIPVYSRDIVENRGKASTSRSRWDFNEIQSPILLQRFFPLCDAGWELMQRFSDRLIKLVKIPGDRLEHRDPASSLRIQAPLSSTPWEAPCGYEPGIRIASTSPYLGQRYAQHVRDMCLCAVYVNRTCVCVRIASRW